MATPSISKPPAPFKAPALQAALSNMTRSPYDTSQVTQALQPYKPYEPPTPGAAPVPATPSAPASAPTPAPASPPPSSSPAPAAAPAPSYQGVAIPDYTADPIYVATLALSQQQVADAQAQAAAATRNALTSYGHTPGTDSSLFPDQNTLLAAEQNPFSTLANMAYTHGQRVHGLEENVNTGHLWYSGEHAKELGTEGHQYLGEQANASAALAQALAGIRSGELNAGRGAQQANLTAEEAAMQRAIDWALAHPSSADSSGGGLGNLPPGTTIPPIVNPDGSSSHGTPGGGQTGYQGGTAAPPGVPAGTPPQQWPGYGSYGADASKQYSSVPYYTGQKPVSGAGSGETGGPAVFANPAYATTTAASTAAGAGGGGTTWNFVRNSTSLPGNAAPSGQPALYNADDPLAAKNVSASGGTAGIWAPVHQNETPQAYAARIAQAAAAHPATLMLDLEAESKGYSGSAGYNFPAQVMAELQRLGVKVPISVTVAGGGEDDFNYQPFVQTGAMIWIQCYGAHPGPDNIDPQTAYNRMIARGIPASQIGLVLAPGQQGVPGVPSALYTIDDQPAGATSSPTSTSSSSGTTAARTSAGGAQTAAMTQALASAQTNPNSVSSILTPYAGPGAPLPQLTPSILQNKLKLALLQ